MAIFHRSATFAISPKIWRFDLYRRGSRCRYVWSTWRRRSRARQCHAQDRHYRSDARKGLRPDGRLHRFEQSLHRRVLRSYAPGFIFTTSLAPVICAGALASIRHLKTSQVEREQQQLRAAMLKERLALENLPVTHRAISCRCLSAIRAVQGPDGFSSIASRSMCSRLTIRRFHAVRSASALHPARCIPRNRWTISFTPSVLCGAKWGFAAVTIGARYGVAGSRSRVSLI